MGNPQDPICKWSFLYETLKHLMKVLPYLIQKTSAPLTAPVLIVGNTEETCWL